MAKRSKGRAKLGANFRPPAATEEKTDESTQAQGEQNPEGAASQGSGDPVAAVGGVKQPEKQDGGDLASEQGAGNADQPPLVTPARFQKLPVVIEALQFNGKNFFDVARFVGMGAEVIDNPLVHDSDLPVIETHEGDMVASPGDWVIKGVKGEFYPCKPDVFAATYAPVDYDGSVEAAQASPDFVSKMDGDSVAVRSFEVIGADDESGIADELDEGFSFDELHKARSAYGDATTLAAFTAAQVSFHQGGGNTWNGSDHPADKAREAAAFVRANPDAPADALPIHLRLKGFRDLPEVTPRVLLAWRIFAFTLKGLDAVDEAELAAYEATKSTPPAASWPGDRALQVSDAPFSATGLSAR